MSDKKFYYSDIQIVGNLVNHYIQNKDYNQLKSLCSSIKNYNHLKDDYHKILKFLENIQQLSDYLFNYHDKSYNYSHFKQEFKKINNIDIEENNIIKIFHQDEFLKFHSDEKYKLFVKIVGNTKQLSNILNVKKLQVMWVANTPVWFVPYENLFTVLQTAHTHKIDIKIEKDNEILFYK